MKFNLSFLKKPIEIDKENSYTRIENSDVYVIFNII